MSRAPNIVNEGLVKNFDVDFAHCDCKGTTNHSTGMLVIPVKWKRKDRNPRNKTRFTCQRCKKSWSMVNAPSPPKGGGLGFDATHPAEQARRRAIHPEYDKRIAVNLRGRGKDLNNWTP